MGNEISACELVPGDHIYTYRALHLYSHHGIYIGDGEAVHFRATQKNKKKPKKKLFGKTECKKCNFNKRRDGGVVKTCLKCFLGGHRLHRFQYNVSHSTFLLQRSGTCITGASDPAETVIGRAVEMYEKGRLSFGVYHAVERNCECFAFYCTTGNSMSVQGSLFKSLVEAVYETAAANEHHSVKGFTRAVVDSYLKKKYLRTWGEPAEEDGGGMEEAESPVMMSVVERSSHSMVRSAVEKYFKENEERISQKASFITSVVQKFSRKNRKTWAEPDARRMEQGQTSRQIAVDDDEDSQEDYDYEEEEEVEEVD